MYGNQSVSFGFSSLDNNLTIASCQIKIFFLIVSKFSATNDYHYIMFLRTNKVLIDKNLFIETIKNTRKKEI